MLRVSAFANSLAAISAVAVVVCAIFSALVPDVVIGVAQTWVHTLNLELARSTMPANPVSLVTGLVTFTILAWIWAAAWAWLYNKLSARP
jgi:hypothetical protein